MAQSLHLWIAMVGWLVSYRPISNLPAVSKLLERIVFRQLYDYLSRADLLPSLQWVQSAYRTHHSTETAVRKVLTDIHYAVDDGDLSVLALLDLSAAFDNVDHDILPTRLRVSYGVGGATLDWLQSYLTHRVECVKRGSDRSTLTTVWFQVQQVSVLGPITHFVHRWIDQPHRGSRSLTSPVWWWHADPGLLSPWVWRSAPVYPVHLSRWCVGLDVVTNAPRIDTLLSGLAVFDYRPCTLNNF